MWQDEIVDAVIDKYLKNGQVLALGSSKAGEALLKKIAFKIEEKDMDVSIVPTSMSMASIAASLNVPIATLDEGEVDVAIEFAGICDENFNFVKEDSYSLVRDKMIAQSAAEFIVVC